MEFVPDEYGNMYEEDEIEAKQSECESCNCQSPSGICTQDFDAMIKRKTDANMKWLFGRDG